MTRAPGRQSAGASRRDVLKGAAAFAAAGGAPAAAAVRVGADQTALITAADLVPAAEPGLQDCALEFAAELARRALAPDGDAAPAVRALRRLAARGRAAGHAGDLYDNRDDGHSALRRADWPQLAFTVYAEELRAARRNMGPNLELRFGAPTIGNSSTAITAGDYRRSLPRLCLTLPEGPSRLAALYAANAVYAYPAHRDYGREHGDLLPANTPFMAVSEGSSGSDQPLLEGLAAALAALRPDAKAFLADRGLIAPTLQFALRRGLRPARDEGAYLSPAAHHAALRGPEVDPVAMVTLANAIRPETAPGATRIAVAEEPAPLARVELFGEALDERLFDTPFAAARLARAALGTRRYVLDAGATEDPNGRALRFHWFLACGDPADVVLSPLDAAGRRAAVTIRWSGRRPTLGRPRVATDRVDVAVAADNGAALSAPAFFSLLSPPNERRALDAGGAVVAVDHADPTLAGRYADPVLWPRRDWRDDYERDAEGRLLGWTRRRGDSVARYTRHGLRAVAFDAEGRPTRAQGVIYPVVEGRGGQRAVTETAVDAFFAYLYAGSGDRSGVVRRLD